MLSEAHPRNSFRVALTLSGPACTQVAKAQPWAEISKRFQRKAGSEQENLFRSDLRPAGAVHLLQ